MTGDHALQQAFVKKFGHGKLLVDESIFPLAYATNVNEQVLEVRGMSPYTRARRHVQAPSRALCALNDNAGIAVCALMPITQCLSVSVCH